MATLLKINNIRRHCTLHTMSAEKYSMLRQHSRSSSPCGDLIFIGECHSIGRRRWLLLVASGNSGEGWRLLSYLTLIWESLSTVSCIAVGSYYCTHPHYHPHTRRKDKLFTMQCRVYTLSRLVYLYIMLFEKKSPWNSEGKETIGQGYSRLY